MAGPHAESEAEVVGRHDHPDTQAGKVLSVSIVTPQGSVLAREVDEVVLPGVLGELGILPGHVPLLAALKPGVLTWRSGEERGVYAVGAGYAQVGALDRIQVLVSRALEADEIDREAAQTELDEAAAELKGMSAEDEGFAEKRARWQWARARLDASGRTTDGGKSAH
jgi:F-type H+-transporting ATPase subunit epsilon